MAAHQVYTLVSPPTADAYQRMLQFALAREHHFLLVHDPILSASRTFSAVRDQLRPLQLWTRRTNRWPHTVSSDEVDVVAYRCDPDAYPILTAAPGIYDLLAPDFPEDLAFIGAAGVAFASVSHERVATILDVAWVKALPELHLSSRYVDDDTWASYFGPDAAACRPTVA